MQHDNLIDLLENSYRIKDWHRHMWHSINSGADPVHTRGSPRILKNIIFR
jgi:hypothetical protein